MSTPTTPPPAAPAATPATPSPPAPSGARTAPAAKGDAPAPTPPGAADMAAGQQPAMPAGTTPASIEAVADSLSACADTLHERIMSAIRQRATGSASATRDHEPAITQETAQALFDQEVLLRQSANRLYIGAAALAAAGLNSVCTELMAVTTTAQDQLRHVAKVQALVALTAGLVTLAGAIAAGKPEQWPAALRDVRARFKAVRDDRTLGCIVRAVPPAPSTIETRGDR